MTEPHQHAIILTRHEMIDALRTIRELHAPEETVSVFGGPTTTICHRCLAPFPCDTYQATQGKRTP